RSTTSAPAPLQYEEPEKSKDKSPVAAAEKSPALRNSPKIPQVSTSTTDETEESKIAAKSVESPVQTKIASPTLPIEPASNSSSDNGETIESLREQLEQQKKVISRLEGKLELIRQKEEQEEELMEEMVNIEAMQNIRDLRAQNEALKLEIQTLRSLTKNEPVVEIESTTTGLDGTPVSAEEKGEYEQKMNQQWATIENLSKQKTQLMQQLKSAGEKVAVLLQENQELSVRLHQVLHPEMFQPKVLPLLEVRSQHNEGNNTRSSPVTSGYSGSVSNGNRRIISGTEPYQQQDKMYLQIGNGVVPQIEPRWNLTIRTIIEQCCRVTPKERLTLRAIVRRFQMSEHDSTSNARDGFDPYGMIDDDIEIEVR
ncbi:M protein repeat protein, partial [Planoprotostelium fungivorum]